MVAPDIHGTTKSGYDTTIVLSFGMYGQYLYQYSTTGSRFEITWTVPFTYSQGCVAYVENTPTTSLDCRVFSNKLWVTTESTSFTTSFNVYVVLGITNPTSQITFSLTLYEYYTDSTHYGVTIMQPNTVDYIIDNS